MTAPSDTLELARCADLTRTYGSGAGAVHALRGVSCALRPGMQVALTGPSGSGKSTLLHLLAGLDTPTSGTIAWPGLGGSPEGRPGLIGMVFQGQGLLPHLTVAGNLAYAARRAAAPMDVHQLATITGITSLLGRLPATLSGGERARVALAMLTLGGANLLILDEPTNHLDVESIETLEDALESYDGSVLLVLGGKEADHRRSCRELRRVGRVRCSHCRPEENDNPVYLCRRLRADLRQVWSRTKSYR